MKKILLVLLTLAFIALTFWGCGEESKGVSSVVYVNSVDSENKEGAHQTLTATKLPYQNDWLEKSLPNVGLRNVSVNKTAKGKFTLNDLDSTGNVYLLSDYAKYGEDSVYHDSYLAVETKFNVLFKDLSVKSYAGSYDDKLYSCDIDGDKIHEIILQQAVGASGGAGQYLSRIFKVDKDEIKEIFASSSVDLYNTGFEATLESDFKLTVNNTFTKYTSTADLKNNNQYVGVYYDETGSVIKQGDILSDSFSEFEPQDIDGDGVFEIVCLQYVSLLGHSDCIGNAKSILKFNSDTQKFAVITAEFIAEK